MHRFHNAYTSPSIPLPTLLRWQLSRLLHPKWMDTSALRVHHRAHLPTEDYALWIGHASVWLGIDHHHIAIDPVLGNIPMFRRKIGLPICAHALHADVILITHAHYDHLDIPSLRLLVQSHTRIIVPTGVKHYFPRALRPHVHELGWYQHYSLGSIKITFVPAYHWSKRLAHDTNKALWGSYVIEHPHHTYYHGGDSALGDHFWEIGERFTIDTAFLPIGAYRPEYIMRLNHMNPQEALEAASRLKTRRFVPIHYGTFKLSDEPLNEPLQWLRELSHTTTTCEVVCAEVGEVIVPRSHRHSDRLDHVP